MDSLNITERRSGAVVVLDLKGNIRIGEDNIALHRVFRALVEKGEKKILLNLADVGYVDSSGLGELVAGYTTLQKNAGEIKLLNLTKRVGELMVITKLVTIFEIFEDETEAVESFADPAVKSASLG